MAQVTHEQKMEMLFITLVEQWQTQAWVALGKIPNPVSNKVERNLEIAKMAIDMLDMIKEKTAGNLTDNENRLLTKVLADLKLNYVDEYEREKREKQEKQHEEQAEASSHESSKEKVDQQATSTESTSAEKQEEEK